MERRPRRRAGRFALVGAVVASAVGVVAIGSEPAAAAVTSISPSVVTVEPGCSASATVRVEAEASTCISVSWDSGVEHASVGDDCDARTSWSTTLSVTAGGSTGDFRVRVTDDSDGRSQSLLVRVREPEPPPPPPTTTTTRPATTTTRRPTTTQAPTTTEPPATTEAPTTTVAPTDTIPPDAFVPIATLIERPLPTEGVFVPLVDPAYRSCLPLTEPCGDAEAGLLFVPARAVEVHWRVVEGTELPAPRSNLALRPLQPVGVAPAEPAVQHYGLAILDLTAPGGQMRTLVRALDSNGSFVAPAGDLGVATAELSGVDPSILSGGAASSMPFGPPEVVATSSLTEAAPVVVVFTSAQAQVLYGVRADPAWGLNHELVPILNGESLPYLVRGVDGPPGLFVPRPDGLRVRAEPDPDDTISAERAERDDDGGLPLWLIALAGVAAIIGAVAIVLRRRRRRAAVADVVDEVSTTPGT